MKKFLIFSSILILIVIMFIITISFLNEETNIKNGIVLTLIGGCNEENKGNTNSMGYVIRTKNSELIVVDGGRDIDSEILMSYITKYGEGQVDHWFITHPHSDHVGALTKLINDENNLKIENIYYHFLEDNWYKEYDKRGYESSHSMLLSIKSSKIQNKIECQEEQIINIDNVKVDIIRVANPDIINTDNGNDASMVFKMTATDVDKSIIFLGDAFLKTSEELLEKTEILKADAVQMAHHGQNGVTKKVYQAINPKVCFFNCPRWLYDNDCGFGYDSGGWKTIEVRGWLEELNTENYVAFEGDQNFEFSETGITKIIDVENEINN